MAMPEERWAPYARTAEIADRLTRFGSVTGSAGEADIAGLIIDILHEIPYFQDNPDNIAVIDSHPVAGAAGWQKRCRTGARAWSQNTGDGRAF